MTHDHDAARIHRADLDREIDMIRTEHLLEEEHAHTRHEGFFGRARQRTGRVLIAAGTALVAPESTAFANRRV